MQKHFFTWHIRLSNLDITFPLIHLTTQLMHQREILSSWHLDSTGSNLMLFTLCRLLIYGILPKNLWGIFIQLYSFLSRMIRNIIPGPSTCSKEFVALLREGGFCLTMFRDAYWVVCSIKIRFWPVSMYTCHSYYWFVRTNLFNHVQGYIGSSAQ